MHVVFEIEGQLFPLRESAAIILAENLRRWAAGQLGEYGIEGARAVADAIEDVLVERSTEPIPLAGEEADSVFYVLNVGLDPSDPAQAEETALYRAVRRLHDERLAQG